ncbi:hypothetical protein LB506_000829 [Fusarium annulatum]|nr:hypothetical protein LB506_000829 [Fusarium annulatum]
MRSGTGDEAPRPIVRHHIAAQETGLVQTESKRGREEERDAGMQGTIMAGQGRGERRGAAKSMSLLRWCRAWRSIS